jgi:hypothetical protein
MASLALEPHISLLGRKLLQTAGRHSLPNMRQRFSFDNWMQRTPAGLPASMPGIDDDMEGAMQHAAQPIRQSSLLSILSNTLPESFNCGETVLPFNCISKISGNYYWGKTCCEL